MTTPWDTAWTEEVNALGRPNDWASAARHQHDRQPSKLMPNFGSWAACPRSVAEGGRLHALLGAVLNFLHL